MKKKIIFILLFISILLALLVGFNFLLSFVKIKPFVSIAVLVISIIIVVGLVIYLLLKDYNFKKINSEKTKHLQQLLKQSFKKVIKRLNKRVFFIWKKQKELYHLPWFLVIGFEKTSKSQLLNSLNPVNLNKELNFSPEISQYGCEWYLTNRAICLDVSQNLLAQTGDDPDIDVNKLWRYFLKLIKRHRHKKPINSVLLMINVEKFQKSSEDEIKQYGQLLYQRLHEIYMTFNRILPVHFLFTECDSIRGYEEFYSDSTFEEHRNTLGFVVPASKSKDSYSEFFAFYDHLIANINNQLFARLHRNDLVENSYPIFSFPLQVACLKTKLSTLFMQLFRDNHYQVPLFIRSFYFSMIDLNQHTFDFFSTDIANKFGLSAGAIQIRKPREDKLFVMHDFFTRSILSASNLEWFTERYKQRNHVLKITGYFLLTVFFCGTAYSLYNSYAKNQTKLNVFISTINDYQSQLKYHNGLVPVSGNILRKSEVLELINSVYSSSYKPYKLHWGLYPGHKISKVTDQLYENELRNNFFPMLIQQAQSQLQQNQQSQQPGLNVFEALAVYLMLGNPDHMDKNFVKNWFASYWNKTYPNSFLVTRYNRQLDNLLKLQLPNVALDASLIAQVRTQLKLFNSAEYFYSYINSLVAKDHNEPLYFSTSSDFDFGKIFGKNAYQLFVQPVYSEKGYTWFESTADNLNSDMSFADWVLNNNSRTDFSVSEFEAQIDRIYFRNYFNDWQQAVQNLNIAPFDDLKNAANELDIIVEPTASPLMVVLNFINKNTAAENILQNKSSSILVDHFAQLNDLLESGADGAKPPITAVMAQLTQLDALVKSINNAENPDKAAFQFASGFMQTGKNDVFNNLLQQAKQVPQPLQNWLNQIVIYSWRAILNSATSYINTQWQNQVWPVYSNTIKNGYPFANNDSQISIEAFSHFFCNNGVFLSFWQTYLAPFVAGDAMQLTLKSQLQNSLPISTSMLNQYRNALLIGNAFCRNTPVAKIQLTLSPVHLTNNSAYSQLDINGSSFIYRHGPVTMNLSDWPGNSNFNQTTLKLYDLNGQSTAATASGLWSLFKFFQQANKAVYNKETDAWVFHFNLGGQSVTYAVKSENRINPLAPNFFSNFKLGNNLANNVINKQTQPQM